MFRKADSVRQTLFSDEVGCLPPPTMARYLSSRHSAIAIPAPAPGASFNVLIQSLDWKALMPLSRPHMKRVESWLKATDSTAGSVVSLIGLRVSIAAWAGYGRHVVHRLRYIVSSKMSLHVI